MDKVLSMIPGLGLGPMREMLDNVDMEGGVKRFVGIIDSMTAEERRIPKKIIDQSRRRRISAGAGVEPHEVNELVKQFEPMSDLMKKMSSMSLRDRMRTMQQMSQGGMLDPGARLAKQKKGTGKRLTSEERAKLRK